MPKNTTTTDREAYLAYRREQYHRNKDKVKQYDINSAIHLLERNGYTVTKAAPDQEVNA